uniref:Uncharacterized protein n=1 Tax=Globisporangium ultimum (strain ATCC 200006 / CBS 805.95 / DAOM BR144) TaxID=431595 RepID=K3WTC9_GLOUD
MAPATPPWWRTRRLALARSLLLGQVVVMLLLEAWSLVDMRRFRVAHANAMNHARAFQEYADSLLAQNSSELQSWMHENNETDEVPTDERMHLSLLHAAYVAHRDRIVSKPGPDQQNDNKNLQLLFTPEHPNLLDKLRQCLDVDIFIPSGIRGFGYCEDAVGYAKFLKSRLLPYWALEIPLSDATLNRTVTYHELCPKTPIVLFNHYWDGVLDTPHFPKDKSVYLMPNVEMYELNQNHFWNVDAVLCKTRTCYERVANLYT